MARSLISRRLRWMPIGRVGLATAASLAIAHPTLAQVDAPPPPIKAPAPPEPIPPALEIKAHRGSVTSLAFSVDGALLVSASIDGEVRLWNRADSQSAGEFTAAATAANHPAFTPDSRSIIYLESSRRLRVRPIRAGAGEGLALEWKADSDISCMDVPLDARTVAAAGGPTLTVFDAGSGAVVSTRNPHDGGSIVALAYSPDGRSLCTASEAGELVVSDVRTGARTLRTMLSPPATSLLFSPAGRSLLALCQDRSLRTIELIKGEAHLIAQFPTLDAPFAYSHLATQMAAGWDSGRVRLWTRSLGQWQIAPFKGGTTLVTAVRYTWDSNWIATGDADGVVRLWRNSPEHGAARAPNGD